MQWLGSWPVEVYTSPQVKARMVLMHGAGAGMDSVFVKTMAQALADHGFEVVCFEFSYMAERRLGGRKRPPPKVEALLVETKAFLEALAVAKPSPALELWLAGKSMGGRLASLLLSHEPHWASGVVALGYPFHPTGQPKKLRVAHLASLAKPMLIVQGTRDTFGRPEEVSSYALGKVKVTWLNSANHDFVPLVASGRAQHDCIHLAASHVAGWICG